MDTVTGDKLLHDVKDVLDDVEHLMRQATTATGEQAAELRARAASALEKAQSSLERVGRQATRAARDAAGATDHWVHDNPWSSIGMAAGIGILVGVLVARR